MMNTQTLNNQFGKRQHFLDWLRVLAFLYLVFFHTGMMFVEWPFHIESGHDSEILKAFMMLTTTWRLDLLFLVSGVAISVMMTKMSIKGFLGQRMIKLFIPLFFACAVVVAPQPYFEAVQKGLLGPGFWEFWTEKYFHFTWLEGMLTPWPTYNHMWYVLYLLLYTVLLVPIFIFINSDRGVLALKSLEQWLIKGTRVLWAPFILYLSVYFYTGHNEITHAIWDDWFAHFVYAYILILGVLFVRMPECWKAFDDIRFYSLAVALLSYGLIMIKYNWNTPLDAIQWDLIEMIMKWSWPAALIGFARHYLNFTNGFIRYGNSVVYPFFILHQTITIIIGFYIIDWGLNGVGEFICIAFGTIALSLALIELVIKRSNILRICFGLKTIKKERVPFTEARSYFL
ncbi:MAG: acyltransferase [Emcibacteraceae bacterium]|nr:acyltransferase [Emcibacteraceae bacterium]